MMVGLVLLVVQNSILYAQFRSIELGIPMVRSSNKGISGLISPIEVINVTNSSKNTFLDMKIPKKLETTVYKEFKIFLRILIVLFFIIGYAVRSRE